VSALKLLLIILAGIAALLAGVVVGAVVAVVVLLLWALRRWRPSRNSRGDGHHSARAQKSPRRKKNRDPEVIDVAATEVRAEGSGEPS
jgi:membrane protein implicated in regulation of membrane protease activity